MWLGGAAPVVDSAGNVWVASGNGSNTAGNSPDASDSVVEMSPSMTIVQAFTPSTWRTDNSADADLGSSPPAVMGNGLVFQAGKSHAAYLLEQSRLGGVGGQVTLMSPFCTGVVDGGDAFSNRVLYAPCSNGVTAVQVNARRRTMRVLWRTSSGSPGPPILAGRYVWTMNRNGTLFGLRKAGGVRAVTLSVGTPANHFPTPSVAPACYWRPTPIRWSPSAEPVGHIQGVAARI